MTLFEMDWQALTSTKPPKATPPEVYVPGVSEPASQADLSAPGQTLQGAGPAAARVVFGPASADWWRQPSLFGLPRWGVAAAAVAGGAILSRVG